MIYANNMEDKIEWYVIPHAGLVGVIVYWIIVVNNKKVKQLQFPGIVVKREPVRIITSDKVISVVSVIKGCNDKIYMLEFRKVKEIERL